MAKFVGVTLSERVIAGLVVDHKVVGELRSFPEAHDDEYALVEMPAEEIVATLCGQVTAVAGEGGDIAAVGLGLPGLVRDGVVEEAPNLPQLKGARIAELIEAQLLGCGIKAPVTILNDADGFAAGVAAAQGKLDSMIRVWTLGVGIGFGRYPFAVGAWEGGDDGRQGALLRMRRARACGGHYGAPRNAAAVPGHGAGGGVCGGEGGRRALPDVQEAVAQGAGGGDVKLDPHDGAGKVLCGGVQCAVRRSADAEGLSVADGEDEPAAELLD